MTRKDPYAVTLHDVKVVQGTLDPLGRLEGRATFGDGSALNFRYRPKTDKIRLETIQHGTGVSSSPRENNTRDAARKLWDELSPRPAEPSDHGLIAAAVVAGVARWEGWGASGEFCIGGLRHSTKLDEFGVPVMTDGMRSAILGALKR